MSKRNALRLLAESIADGRPLKGPALGPAGTESSAIRNLHALSRLRSHFLAGTGQGSGVSRSNAPGEPESSDETRRWGDFALLEELGRGAFGCVYRAWDMKLYRQVAVKLVRLDRRDDAEWASDLVREGRLLAKVEHPHVVRVYGVDERSIAG
jgi:serine/threonine protein kinase